MHQEINCSDIDSDFDEDRLLNSGQKIPSDSDTDLYSQKVNSSQDTSSSCEGSDSQAAFERLFGQRHREKTEEDIREFKKESLSKINSAIRKLTDLYILVDNTIDYNVIQDINSKIEIIHQLEVIY